MREARGRGARGICFRVLRGARGILFEFKIRVLRGARGILGGFLKDGANHFVKFRNFDEIGVVLHRD